MYVHLAKDTFAIDRPQREAILVKNWTIEFLVHNLPSKFHFVQSDAFVFGRKKGNQRYVNWNDGDGDLDPKNHRKKQQIKD